MIMLNNKIALVIAAMSLLGAFGLVGCSSGEAPAPQYTYIYSEAPKPPSSANTLDLGGSPSMGVEHAKVTIIESSDFQCPFCGRVVPTMKSLLAAYPDDVRVVFKHNPLGFHKRAFPAAKAAMAAHAQGKFWEYHDMLFAQKKFEDADLERYAQDLALDMEAFRTALNDPAIDAKIRHDQASMVGSGAGGTPAFFVNGKLISGAKPLSAFQAEVNAAIAEADKLIASGTKLEDIHRVVAAKNVNQAFVDAVVDGKEVVGGARKAQPKKRPEPPVDKGPVEIFIDDSDPVHGKPDAKVTIAIFSDFECPFCGKMVPTMERIKKEYGDDVRMVFKQHPLSFHKNARLAAKASLAANEQGKFWEYHDLLFENMKALKRADLIGYAKGLGMDVTVFEKAMDAPRMEEAIKEDLVAAQKAGVRGTPHSFVNGQRVKGARPFAAFQTLIDEALGTKKKSPEVAVPTPQEFGSVAKVGASREAVSSPESLTVVEGSEQHEIVVFIDLQDRFSGKVLRELVSAAREVGKRGRIAVRHLPKAFHSNSVVRARAAQGLKGTPPKKLLAWMLRLMASEKSMDRAGLESLAEKARLPKGVIGSALRSDAIGKVITGDSDFAKRLSVVSSPTIFFSGKRYLGTGGYGNEALQAGMKKAWEEIK